MDVNIGSTEREGEIVRERGGREGERNRQTEFKLLKLGIEKNTENQM